MSVSESVLIALRSLRANKMRSALTLLGVIIGIAAVIAILTLGAALKTQFTNDLDKFGANNFTVAVEERPEPGEPDISTDANPFGGGEGAPADAYLTEDMLASIRSAMGEEISSLIVGEYATYPGTLSVDDTTDTEGSIQPTNPDYITSSQYRIEAGRSLSEEDIASARTVAVISNELATALYGADFASAIGQSLDYESSDGKLLSLNVVGVYSPPDTSALFGGAPNNYALVPYPLEADISERPLAGEAFSNISVRAAAGQDKEAVGHHLQQVVDALYANDEDYRAKVSDFSEDLASFNKMVTVMSMVIAAIGGISLLVGGIGVMNIMLITVTERTREIGVRKALGARRRDIRVQFVIEAIIVCLIGGLIGVVLGSIAGMVGANLMGAFVFPPLSAVLVSLLFSLAIGLFFGFYPANRAAKLDPIEALRHE
ncbi:ABC transporter permease [Corynebacterium lizhenjunii]|uniref:ABC transporter permease n=1 Tax=Corynebacterium lizhenjunii TaxID=2709394 RepID=UPI0013ECAE86|nr:ABC transporter permease [Corynebacterium lizhenjunii]